MDRYDAVVAGGGLIGASIALELARAQLRVAVFDAQEPGLEASWAGAGIISPAPEAEEMAATVPLGRASAELYPEHVRMIEELSGESTGYRGTGALEVFSGDGLDPDAKLTESLTRQHGAGLRAVRLTAAEARELEPGLAFPMCGAILRPDEASVDNRALTRATLKAARRQGVEIFAGRAATGLWQDGGRCGGLLLAGDRVAAEWTVIAAGAFSSQIPGAGDYAPVFPAKGQMLALRCGGLQLERVIWGETVYLVPRNDGRILVGATVERVGYDRAVTPGAARMLLDAATHLVPALEKSSVEERWAGLRPDTPDHLPILGPTDRDGLLVATGHFRSGILLAPITARLIREWVQGRKSTIDCAAFSPLRFRPAGSVPV